MSVRPAAFRRPANFCYLIGHGSHDIAAGLPLTLERDEVALGRFFQERIIDEVRRSVRYHRPLSLFMADIDHFKRVNDTFGHQTGNTVLHHVATLIRNKVRNTDIVTRYGGEEFAVLLPETDAGDAMIVAEHVRATIAASRPPRLPHVTISLGVSTHQRGDLDGARMIGEADHALYQAKQAGRNRSVIAVPAQQPETILPLGVA